MAVNLSPIGNDAPFTDGNGNPLSGGLLYSYTAGSSTPETTYTTSAGSVANANPIVLGSTGYPQSGGNVVSVWLTAGVSYKFTLKTSAGVDIWTRDNISGINDTTVTIDQWVSGPAPTYVSATSFTLVGDQTTTFHVGRRLKTTNSGGTIYSTIITSAFGALTTITVVNDSGVLDSGLSAVSYSLLSTTNPSTPLLTDAYPIVSGSADKTKKLRLEVDGLTTATTRVLTVQDSDDTIVGRATTDTLTNKTITGTTNTVGAGVLGTEQATTSGTAIDFTSIPSWAKEITFLFSSVSTNGTSAFLVQLGDAGGVENTGYVSTGGDLVGAGAAASTAGFNISTSLAAASAYSGKVVITLENAASFRWIATGILSRDDGAQMHFTGGRKALSAALDRVRLTMVNGTDAFDAGAVNILYS